MTALSLATLGGGGGPSLGEGFRKAANPQSASAFEDSLARQGVTPAQNPANQDPAKIAADPKAAAVDPASDAAGRERVRRSLELDGAKPAATSTSGDTILGGLQKLRGVFDDRNTRLNAIMKSNVVDTNALLAMQMEVAQYTILVDVSSKLTGKATQSLDTLMKGQ